MKRLSQIIDTYSLDELIEASEVVDGDVEPKPNNEPEDEMKFVRFHKTQKHTHPAYDADGNGSKVYNASNVKVAPSVRRGKKGGTDDRGDAFNPRNEELEEAFLAYMDDKYDLPAIEEEYGDEGILEVFEQELEVLDELSKDAYSRYNTVAGSDMAKARNKSQGIDKAKDILKKSGTTNTPDLDKAKTKAEKTYDKRNRGRTHALRQLKKKGVDVVATRSGKAFGYNEEEELDEGGPTRKHFQATADTVKAIENENKRREHASAHAERYARENPRFNRSKFMQACGVKE